VRENLNFRNNKYLYLLALI